MTTVGALFRVLRRAVRERVTPAEAIRRDVADLERGLRRMRERHLPVVYARIYQGRWCHYVLFDGSEASDDARAKQKVKDYLRVFA